ncbi:MAG: FkbM family methyltransferase, partial [SAR202 cluster bacterium]|nr:FkbM family methyltransferase [SAR202 cluster bacterium]
MKTTIFETPVVLIVYNRPEETYLVLKKILDVNPNKLLIIADGPKNQKDKLLTDEVRKIIRESCDESNMITNYADENMGTKKRIVSGLNWVFDQVNKAIILEDDCLPDTSFFKYAETLLEYYKDDYRIMTISGNNFYE